MSTTADRTAFDLIDSIVIKLWDRYVESYGVSRSDRKALAIAYYIAADRRDEFVTGHAYDANDYFVETL